MTLALAFVFDLNRYHSRLELVNKRQFDYAIQKFTNCNWFRILCSIETDFSSVHLVVFDRTRYTLWSWCFPFTLFARKAILHPNAFHYRTFNVIFNYKQINKLFTARSVGRLNLNLQMNCCNLSCTLSFLCIYKGTKTINIFLVHKKSHSLHSPFKNNNAMQFFFYFMLASLFFLWVPFVALNVRRKMASVAIDASRFSYLVLLSLLLLLSLYIYRYTYLSFHVPNIGSSLNLSTNVSLE